MFNGLRWRLTLVYISAALLLLVCIGGGSYWLIDNHFSAATDRALLERMALEFTYLDAPLSPGLRLFAPNVSQDERSRTATTLSATFVYPLDSTGSPLYDPNEWRPPLPPDQEAALEALRGERVWRTVTLSNSVRVRLLSERLTRSDGPAVLQVGRVLSDQDAVLRQLVSGLLALSVGMAVLLGWASWWLAGRSLRPAQLAWERQQAFIANASHELRAPLTLLRASTEVALRGMDAADPNRELLQDVIAESDHMNQLVEDLLLLGRLDAQRIQFDLKPLDSATLLHDVQRQMQVLVQQKQVRLAVASADGAVLADQTRLRQVILIALDNALRHTPAGGSITLAAEPKGQRVQISIRDTGQGIPAQHLKHIFERFYRVDSSRGSGSSGAGLGLAIAKALIESQHGSMSIDSREGAGTTVVLSLPKAG